MAGMSRGSGGRSNNLSDSNLQQDMTRPSTRGTKKGDGGPSPSFRDEPPICWRPGSAACLARALRRRSLCRRHVRRVGMHRYVGATLEALAELNAAIAKCKKGMVFAHADVLA